VHSPVRLDSYSRCVEQLQAGALEQLQQSFRSAAPLGSLFFACPKSDWIPFGQKV